jgi:hypothetical protein
MLLQGHQVLHGVHASLQTGGNQAGEHTGNVGTVLGFVQQRILTLTHKQFQGALA